MGLKKMVQEGDERWGQIVSKEEGEWEGLDLGYDVTENLQQWAGRETSDREQRGAEGGEGEKEKIYQSPPALLVKTMMAMMTTTVV